MGAYSRHDHLPKSLGATTIRVSDLEARIVLDTKIKASGQQQGFLSESKGHTRAMGDVRYKTGLQEAIRDRTVEKSGVKKFKVLGMCPLRLRIEERF